ncbi:UDP-N-acetylglucosamine--undecaprenyl-phosphate N-acetylglucosaminephosphotransferase [Paraferrimonas sedimenticola]|nr:UDP-N-acetylglucosamine--undecaprenyl-phosphate N-acetylglucosaminephosphotransferase [Paraferrimonas sedimenticola]
MDTALIAAILLCSFLGSFLTLTALRKLALSIGLVDKPDHRKHHAGAVPLVGGLAVFTGVLVGGLALTYIAEFPWYNAALFYGSSGLLVLIGAIDDKLDLSVRARLGAQALAAVVMMFGSGAVIIELGALLDFGAFSFGSVSMGGFGYLFTLLAVVFAINAYNMVDGIDGLIGGMAVSAFLGLGFMFALGGHFLFWFCLLFVAVLLPYLMFNLELLGNHRRVFMGDAGSMFIGFSLIWLLARGTQGGSAAFSPVLALFFVAMPVMDMVGIMLRRVRKGQSPLRPDRDHLHHIFMRAGFDSRQTLALMTLGSFVITGIGVTMEVSGVPQGVMLLVFLGIFAFYNFSLSHIWRILVVFRKLGLVKPLAKTHEFEAPATGVKPNLDKAA